MLELLVRIRMHVDWARSDGALGALDESAAAGGARAPQNARGVIAVALRCPAVFLSSRCAAFTGRS